MRISAMTVLALSVVALTGCGGIVNGCVKAGAKMGAASSGGAAIKTGVGAGLYATERGAAHLGTHTLETGAVKGMTQYEMLRGAERVGAGSSRESSGTAGFLKEQAKDKGADILKDNALDLFKSNGQSDDDDRKRQRNVGGSERFSASPRR